MGSNAQTAIKDASAIVQFSVASERPSSIGASTNDSFSLQFSRDELLSFFEKLDKIQQQCDLLSA